VSGAFINPFRLWGADGTSNELSAAGEQFTVGRNKVDAHIGKLMQRGRLGAPIGKRDYLGNLSQQNGGDYS
jgi:hypothetical protein